MHEVIRIKRLKKDGSADAESLRPPAVHLRGGASVVIPIDGVYGVAQPVSVLEKDGKALHETTELIICDFGNLERRARFEKSDYDFLKRVWPDEITVLMHSREGAEPLSARMPQTPVSRELVNLAGGVIVFTPIVNEKGKPRFKLSELEQAAKHTSLLFVIDEWCRAHQLPTVIDIRHNPPKLVRAGRVSMDEISSLFYLGPSD